MKTSNLGNAQRLATFAVALAIFTLGMAMIAGTIFVTCVYLLELQYWAAAVVAVIGTINGAVMGHATDKLMNEAFN